MEWSEGWSVLNQPVDVLPGYEKARWNGQRGGQCSINQFTYQLEIRKRDGMVRGVVSAQSTSSHTPWKRESEMKWSEGRSVLNQPVHIHPGNEKARWNGQRRSVLNQPVHILA